MKEYYANSRLTEAIAVGTSIMEQEETGRVMTAKEVANVREKYTKEFSEHAHKGALTYRRQMIVIASTIFEAMMNEFLRFHFTKFPEKMYNYVSDDGRIKFKDLIDFSSKEEVLSYYSKISAKSFTAKPWKVVLNRLEELLKIDISSKEKVLEMLLLRNEIIHEGVKMEVDNDDVFDFIEAVEDVLEILSVNQ